MPNVQWARARVSSEDLTVQLLSLPGDERGPLKRMRFSNWPWRPSIHSIHPIAASLDLKLVTSVGKAPGSLNSTP